MSILKNVFAEISSLLSIKIKRSDKAEFKGALLVPSLLATIWIQWSR